MEQKYYNPIRLVDGFEIPCPSVYQYSLNDISDDDAGRTEALVMEKKRIGQARTIHLEWQNVSILDCAKILQAFNPEYIMVDYLDAMSGTFEKREFYVGDRSTPLYNSRLGIWSNISFNIIERGAAL